jgi:hypothetical protein
MALKGNLKDFSLTQLLNVINLARKTGALTLNGPQGSAIIYFKEGRLVCAARDGQDMALATMLLRMGKITEEQSRAIMSRSDATSDKELGLLLVNAGYITQKDVLLSTRKHVLDLVYPLFTWQEGLFRFEPNQLPNADKITTPIDLENVILEGSRRLREWEMLQDEIPDLGVALRFVKRPDTNLRKISLSPEEWRVISFIDPRNSLKQIAKQIGVSDLEMRKIVYGLLSAGLVELIGSAEKRKPEPSSTVSREKPQEAPAPIKRGIILRLIDRIRRL